MARNQLPEGVGKKIVEALKRQSEADIAPVENNGGSTFSNSLPLTEIEDLPEIKYNETIETAHIDEIGEINELPEVREISNIQENVIVEETPKIMFGEPATIAETPAVNTVEMPKFTVPKPQNTTADNAQTLSYSNVNLKQENAPQQIHKHSPVTLPPNVATLQNLINGLPNGVTKQTGAQIIKQTLEAMGLPMNSVLKEAQMFQEDLNCSARECMIKIQEYKTNIMQLERSVEEYQQNITQVNDIISLFLSAGK